jgi:hypothetical protein
MLTSKIIQLGNAFGYELYDASGVLVIRQPFDFTQPGMAPYVTQDAATTAANAAITALTPPATSTTTSTSGTTTGATS